MLKGDGKEANKKPANAAAFAQQPNRPRWHPEDVHVSIRAVPAFGMAQGKEAQGLGGAKRINNVIKCRKRKERGQLVCLAEQDHTHSFSERGFWSKKHPPAVGERSGGSGAAHNSTGQAATAEPRPKPWARNGPCSMRGMLQLCRSR